jgi:hypothetical protein
MTAAPNTDTSPAAAEAQVGVLRRLLPERRLELAVEMSLTARELLVAGLRAAHPDWSEAQVRRQVLSTLHGGAVLPDHPK